MGELRTDVKLGLRRLLRSPAATLTVLTALPVGIGLSALMFSLIDGALTAVAAVPGRRAHGSGAPGGKGEAVG